MLLNGTRHAARAATQVGDAAGRPSIEPKLCLVLHHGSPSETAALGRRPDAASSTFRSLWRCFWFSMTRFRSRVYGARLAHKVGNISFLQGLTLPCLALLGPGSPGALGCLALLGPTLPARVCRARPVQGTQLLTGMGVGAVLVAALAGLEQVPAQLRAAQVRQGSKLSGSMCERALRTFRAHAQELEPAHLRLGELAVAIRLHRRPLEKPCQRQVAPLELPRRNAVCRQGACSLEAPHYLT
mmetsp:Transcript_122806/g.342177  ORF Transcript_122806/g.342177 Transcript_122806/m.342177 type:complete len:242 (+) Transcript_122806:871-1596(+)